MTIHTTSPTLQETNTRAWRLEYYKTMLEHFRQYRSDHKNKIHTNNPSFFCTYFMVHDRQMSEFPEFVELKPEIGVSGESTDDDGVAWYDYRDYDSRVEYIMKVIDYTEIMLKADAVSGAQAGDLSAS